MLNGSSVDRTPVRTQHEKCVEVLRARLGVAPKLPPELRPQVLVIEQGTLELLNHQDRAAIADLVVQGMGCVVLLGPIHVSNHPGAVVTPRIRELIDMVAKHGGTGKADGPASALANSGKDHGRGRVITALNIGQNPLWLRGTLGIESVYSEVLQSIYQSIGRPPARVEASVRPRQPAANTPWTATVFGRGARARIRIIPDLPVAECSLMNGYGAVAPRTVVAEVEAKATAAVADEFHCAMPPLPGGNYILLAQMFDERNRVLGWSLTPVTVVSLMEIAHFDAGTGVFLPHEPMHVTCTIKNGYPPLAKAQLVTQLDDPRGKILARTIAPCEIAHGESTRDLVVNLSHAEHCSVRLQLVVLDGDRVLARRSLWLSSEQIMPRIDFHVGPYDDFNAGWSVLWGRHGHRRPDAGSGPAAFCVDRFARFDGTGRKLLRSEFAGEGDAVRKHVAGGRRSVDDGRLHPARRIDQSRLPYAAAARRSGILPPLLAGDVQES